MNNIKFTSQELEEFCDEIKIFNFWIKHNHTKDLFKCFNVDDFKKMLKFSEKFKISNLTEDIYKFIAKSEIDISQFDILTSQKIMTIMSPERLLSQSIELLQTLKFNPTKYECLNPLFGVESETTLDEIFDFKDRFENNYMKYLNSKDYNDLGKYLIDKYKNYTLTDSFYINDFIESEQENCILMDGDLSVDVNFYVRWYEFLIWCLDAGKNWRQILSCYDY